jgi:ADP-ribose pyrophosphatase YjhB (NUDIX family)
MGIDLEMFFQDLSFFYTTKETPEGIVDVILVYYFVKCVGEIKPGDDIREWKWLPIDRLESEDLAPNIKPMLREFGFLE